MTINIDLIPLFYTVPYTYYSIIPYIILKLFNYFIFWCRLLFSQSLFTLDLIQDFLENTEDIADDEGGPYGTSWIHGIDFFRIDGSASTKNREDYCEQFNDVTNTKYYFSNLVFNVLWY